jgi:hypothetical protein
VISLWSELDHCVEWNLHPRASILGDIHEVGVDATDHCLMGNDHDIFVTLHFHNDRFQPSDDVSVALTASVTIIVPVLFVR